MIHQTVYLLLRLCTAVAGKYHQLRGERETVISGMVQLSMMCVWLGFVILFITPLAHSNISML